MSARTFFSRLWKARGGTAAVDFALTLPILVLLTVGVMQLGIAFLANAGLRNAVEVGARYAVIYPYPTDDAIKSKVRANTFGMNTSQLEVNTPVHGTSNGQSYIEVTANYPIRLNLFLIATPSFTISYTRRSYLN